MPTAKQIKSRFTRKQITQKILRGLLLTGAVGIASTSPYFVLNFLSNIRQFGLQGLNKKERQQSSSVFSYLKQNGDIQLKYKGKQVYISLTESGKKKARHFQIDELEIRKQKKWDKKWRIILFDIPETTRIKREALRGKLIQLGFSKLQKSAWVHPFPCHDELKMLQDFFGISSDDYVYFEAGALNKDLNNVRRKFNII